MNQVARMRTAEGAMALIRKEDPGTAITLRAIRRVIREGRVPYVPVGAKKLVSVDALLRYFGATEGGDVQ